MARIGAPSAPTSLSGRHTRSTRGCVNLVASVPVAAGMGLKCRLNGESRVTMTFFGDGATAHGSFHEGVNFAAARKLPIVFILENNQWALSTPVTKHNALDQLADRAAGYGIPSICVDGNDVLTVHEAAREAVERARHGGGPTLIEAVTLRMEGHSITDPAQYVSQALLDEWTQKDPILRFRHFLEEHGVLNEESDAYIREEIEAEIADAVEYAEASPLLPSEAAAEGVFAVNGVSPSPSNGIDTSPESHSQMSYRAAIRDGLRLSLQRDDRVFVLGEDVEYGGVYGITKGLLDEFGEHRVIDTPIAETAIVGAATGAALFGMRPVAEIQFADFIAPAMDELVNMTAKYHYRTGWRVPLVLRAPAGIIIEPHGSTGPFHSQSPEAWFAHAPGLKIVIPTTPYDAKGLLLAAIEDPDPVLFLEQKALYNLRGRVPAGYYTVPFGEAVVRRAGNDISIVTYGAMVQEALQAAEVLAGDNINVEILDLRTLVPLDREAVVRTVRKTNKILITHEANRTAGFGAELAALVAEEAFEWLDGPITRLTAPDTPTPSSRPMAEYWYPEKQRGTLSDAELESLIEIIGRSAAQFLDYGWFPWGPVEEEQPDE